MEGQEEGSVIGKNEKGERVEKEGGALRKGRRKKNQGEKVRGRTKEGKSLARMREKVITYKGGKRRAEGA